MLYIYYIIYYILYIYIYIIFILYSDISEYNIQMTFDYLNPGPTWHPPPSDPRTVVVAVVSGPLWCWRSYVVWIGWLGKCFQNLYIISILMRNSWSLTSRCLSDEHAEGTKWSTTLPKCFDQSLKAESLRACHSWPAIVELSHCWLTETS